MKKFLLFAAAMLCLVACNKNASDVTAPARKVVLHATVDNGGAANGPARIAPVDPTATTVEFAWEENDQIKVVTDAGTYTLTAININGNQADFEGEIAGSLDNYTVYYGYNPDAASQTVEYIANSFKPCVKATGCSGESFVLNEFYPVLKLQLKGSKTLGKIEYLIGTNEKATMTFTDGIALNTTTATVIYLPVADVDAAGFTLKFYDNAATPALIMEKATTFNLADKMGKIVAFPELVVEDPYNGHDYVDLGLPSGLKWATMNIGATTVEGYGSRFAWGETTSKTSCSWGNYKFGNSPYALTKYCTISSYGTVDNKTVLDLEDDAAHVNWGGRWRMPTKAEFTELINNCTSTYTTQNGVNGLKVVSQKNGNSIFFPAAGTYNAVFNYLQVVGSDGTYWASTLSQNPNEAIRGVDFSSSKTQWSNSFYDRFTAQSVRAVCPAN